MIPCDNSNDRLRQRCGLWARKSLYHVSGERNYNSLEISPRFSPSYVPKTFQVVLRSSNPYAKYMASLDDVESSVYGDNAMEDNYVPITHSRCGIPLPPPQDMVSGRFVSGSQRVLSFIKNARCGGPDDLDLSVSDKVWLMYGIDIDLPQPCSNPYVVRSRRTARRSWLKIAQSCWMSVYQSLKNGIQSVGMKFLVQLLHRVNPVNLNLFLMYMKPALLFPAKVPLALISSVFWILYNSGNRAVIASI